MAPHDAETPARLHAALVRLHAVLTEVASDVVSRIDERCPYRARQHCCTFSGGCVNQRRGTTPGDRAVQCAGDHQLRRAGR